MNVKCGQCNKEFEIKEEGKDIPQGRSKLDFTSYKPIYIDGEKKGIVICKECRTTNIYTIK